MKKNVLLLLVDGLRFDVFESPEEARHLAPFIMSLADDGVLHRVVSNGMVTQVAMPPLLTQTYPLDFGGVNRGIIDRPKSYLEALSDAGYETYFVGAHFITGPLWRFERGAKHTRGIYDYTMMIERYLRFDLEYRIKLWLDGEIGESELVERLQTDYDGLLEYIEKSDDRVRSGVGNRKLGHPSQRFIRRVREERALVKSRPMAVIAKFRNVPGLTLHHYLGRAELPRRRLAWDFVRIIDQSINSLIQRVTGTVLSLFWRTVSPTASEVSGAFEAMFQPRKRPWAALIHYMDVHDSFYANRWFHYFNKLRFLPRLLKVRRRFGTRRPWPYDLALIYLDRQLAALTGRLRRDGAMESTIVAVCGDHGLHWDTERAREAKPELGLRSHYEHLEVPLIIAPCGQRPSGAGLHDSTSISASLLQLCGVDGGAELSARSIFEAGHPVSICETVGRGNCDLERRDIFFTITGDTHKLMLTLRDSELVPIKLFDRRTDPRELKNCIEDKAQSEFIHALIVQLIDQRGGLLKKRGVNLSRYMAAAE